MLNEILIENEKVKEKHHSTIKSISDMISNLKSELIYLENDLEVINNSMDDNNPNEKCLNRVNITINKINELEINKNYNTLCNNFYGNLTKLGKIMSKNLESDNIENYNLYDYNKSLFYRIIVKDLYRRGDFKTADSLIKESQIYFEQNFRFIFNDLNIVTRDLKDNNIDTLIEWCIKNKILLDNMNSTLHFEALKLKVNYLII